MIALGWKKVCSYSANKSCISLQVVFYPSKGTGPVETEIVKPRCATGFATPCGACKSQN